MPQGIPPRSQVRETGRMLDRHGFVITFGVDHGCVTIDAGSITVSPAADEADDEFTRLYFQAVKAAQDQAGTPCTGACCIGASRDDEKGRGAMSNEQMSALAPRVSTEAAAVCSIGRHGFCNWFDSSAGAEISATAEQHAAEISAAAQQHAAENPGHKVTCQVKETRTWSILRSDTTEGE